MGHPEREAGSQHKPFLNGFPHSGLILFPSLCLLQPSWVCPHDPQNLPMAYIIPLLLLPEITYRMVSDIGHGLMYSLFCLAFVYGR